MEELEGFLPQFWDRGAGLVSPCGQGYTAELLDFELTADEMAKVET